MDRCLGPLVLVFVFAAVVAACGLDPKSLASPLVSPDQPAPKHVTSVQAVPILMTPIDRADAWEDVWQTLERRPLQLPSLTSDHSCPVSPVEPVFGESKGVGNGPIYPLTGPHHPGAVPLGLAPDADGRYASKILWIGDPVYGGPALIRGHQLDGPDIVRFREDDGAAVLEELRFAMWTGVSSPDFPPEWRQRPSSATFASSGCYAFQIDGVSFSRVIVERVEPNT